MSAQEITTDELDAKIQAFPPKSENIFGLKIFQNGNRKSTVLINNQDSDFFIKSKNRWFSFNFEKSLFVTKIVVRATGFDPHNNMTLSYEDAFTKRVTEKRSPYLRDKLEFEFLVDAFIGGFGVLPDQKFFSSPKIIGVDVYGFDESSFRRGLQFFENIERARARVIEDCNIYIAKASEAEAKEVELSETIEILNGDIDEKNTEIENLNIEIKSENSKKEKLRTENSALQITQKQLTDTLTSLEANIDAKKSTQHELSLQVAEKEKKLRTLENDINLFPTEISGYVTQGSKNINTYMLVGAAPMAIIAFLTYRLITNSESLLDFYANNSTINIIEFLASRLPYVIVSMAILGVCYTFIHRLISEIIGINRRRQDLYKISIVATDVSNASASGSIIDGDKEYKYRTYIKMEMLREHLRRHMGEGFTFEKKGGLLAMISDISTSSLKGPDEVIDDE